MADSILPALRAETGEAHQQLEDAIAIEHCLTDLSRYRRLLEVFLGFYRSLEPRLAGLSAPNFSERLKTPWLEADLRALGLATAQIDGLPDCPDLPRTDAATQAWGCLYVLEGATLGGRHISAMMARSEVPAGARQFFGGYGERTGERWRDFTATLESYATGVDNAGRGEIIQGAGETFACLHRWFVRQCPTDEFRG